MGSLGDIQELTLRAPGRGAYFVRTEHLSVEMPSDRNDTCLTNDVVYFQWFRQCLVRFLCLFY